MIQRQQQKRGLKYKKIDLQILGAALCSPNIVKSSLNIFFYAACSQIYEHFLSTITLLNFYKNFNKVSGSSVDKTQEQTFAT